MKYWDSSALLSTIVEQQASERMRAVSREDPAVSSWWGSLVECVSGLTRLQREQSLPEPLPAAMARVRAAAAMWSDVMPSDDVREQALRLLRVHALRGQDALQLAAAIVATDHQPSTMAFVTLDARLAGAADKEGFHVIV